jgi:hypothetical protein
MQAFVDEKIKQVKQAIAVAAPVPASRQEA